MDNFILEELGAEIETINKFLQKYTDSHVEVVIGFSGATVKRQTQGIVFEVKG